MVLQKATIKIIKDNSRCTMWAITWMSFFWSTSSLMVFSVMPAFLVDVLHIGHAKIGIIEGVAIASSFASKFFAGILSDILKKRKPLILLGTVLSAITKPSFAFCIGPLTLFTIRFSDRLSKGLRSAPTDALIADVSKNKMVARNYGRRQALYTLGDVVGAILAMSIMLLSNNNYRLCFALSFIPAFLAVIILIFLVRPNPMTHPRANNEPHLSKIKLNDLKEFSPTFWWLMIAFFFLMLGRFSSAFLTLKAKDVGWLIAYLPVIVVVKDLVHAGVSWPSGSIADRFCKKQMFLFGLFVMFAAQASLAYTHTVTGVFLGIILLGVHLGATQGLLKALVAKNTPSKLRGTAFSLFFLISGIAIFLGNMVAGSLSEAFGIHAPFLGGASFTIISIGVMYVAFFRTKIIKPALKITYQGE